MGCLYRVVPLFEKSEAAVHYSIDFINKCTEHIISAY